MNWNNYSCLAIEKGRSFRFPPVLSLALAIIVNPMFSAYARRPPVPALRIAALRECAACCACPCDLLLFVWNRRSVRIPSCIPKSAHQGAKNKSGSRPFHTETTTQTNATDTIATGGAPEQTCHAYRRRLIGCDEASIVRLPT
jgi:hypothetical protein